MTIPRALVLHGDGINCEAETVRALSEAGAIVKKVMIEDVIQGGVKLDDYQMLMLPGGFSFADNIRAGVIYAVKVRYKRNEAGYRMGDSLRKFVDDGKLIGGICNGFQSLVELGMLPGTEDGSFEKRATLARNDSGQFRDAWVYMRGQADETADWHSDTCIWTRGIKNIEMPIRHGEGKFIPNDEGVMGEMYRNGQVVFKYTDAEGREDAGYPFNPNGSRDNIAGICDRTGRVFGLMPHPEAWLDFTQHPRWTRMRAVYERNGEKMPDRGEGRLIFENAVEYAGNI